MNKLLAGLLVATLVAIGACGGPGPLTLHAFCLQSAADTCQKLYACSSGAALMAVQAVHGQTESDCETQLVQLLGCNQGFMECPTGKTFDAKGVATCLSNAESTTCAEFLTPGYVAPGCGTPACM